MKIVYGAAHGVEAQIVVDVLAGEGIEARVHGAGLLGAAGEIPASGLVHVWVPDENVEQALAVIARWKAIPVEPEAGEPLARSAPGRARRIGLGSFLLGAAIAAVVSYAYLRLPAWSDKLDYDQDGRPDETYFYQGQKLDRITEDRNRDGNTDVEQIFEGLGDAEERLDDDFDGRYETTLDIRKGSYSEAKSDRDGDGFFEYRASYRDGVLDTETLFANRMGDLRIRRTYRGGWLATSDIDTDGDGKLDTRRKHDAFGEIVSTEPL